MNLICSQGVRLALAGLLITLAALLLSAATARSAGFTGRAHLDRHSLSAVQMARLERRAKRYGMLARGAIARRNAEFRRTHSFVRAGDAPDPGALAAMRDIAITMSSLNGVASPSGGLVFSARHQMIQTTLTGDKVLDDQPAFAVVVHGNFIGYTAHTPTGVVPTGTILTITFDANTLQVTDWSLQHLFAGGLASLGISTALGI
jgi:hypothetical protein